ncbi:hypothetical protein PsYK624_151570 [Phanerochaete sordida]|uniref:Uncharacterized protein n=1 Tax=Phanerochaete sordida TaxID=48140 RepID=A0A9P3LL14_9APHY|nr:hypothetical protein PsYK624_151570 [Phanerochaete sordida]
MHADKKVAPPPRRTLVFCPVRSARRRRHRDIGTAGSLQHTSAPRSHIASVRRRARTVPRLADGRK